METNNSSIIPKEAALVRLGKLIDNLNGYDQHIGKLLEDTGVSCISPFYIPGWPRELHRDEYIVIRKKILYPDIALAGISLRTILANIRVYISSDGNLGIQTEEIQEQPFKLFGIKSGQDKRVHLKEYHSATEFYEGDQNFNWKVSNTSQGISCCLIIFCQITDEVYRNIEKRLQEQLENKGNITEQCRGIPAMIKRCFEPFVPYAVADILAQE